MRRLIQRVRAFLGPKLARARDLFPLTLLGVLVAGGGALAMFVYGIGRLDLVLLVLGIVALGLAAISLVLTSATAIVLYFRLKRRAAGPAGFRHAPDYAEARLRV